MGHPPGNKGRGAGIAFIRAHLADESGPCLIWPMFRDKQGYGQTYYLGESHWAHRLMCKMANGPAPTPDHEASHSCGNGHGGCIHPKHLSWKTASENQMDRRAHGTSGLGVKRKSRYKLSAEQVATIRSLKGKVSQDRLASDFGVRRQTIGEILRGEIWKTERMDVGFNTASATAAANARWAK